MIQKRIIINASNSALSGSDSYFGKANLKNAILTPREKRERRIINASNSALSGSDGLFRENEPENAILTPRVE